MKQQQSPLIGPDGELQFDVHVSRRSRLLPGFLLAFLLMFVGVLVAVASYLQGDAVPLLNLPAVDSIQATKERVLLTGKYGQPDFSLDYSTEQNGPCIQRTVYGEAGGTGQVTVQLLAGNRILAQQPLNEDRHFSLTVSGEGSDDFDVVLVDPENIHLASVTDLRLDGTTTHSCVIKILFRYVQVYLTK